MCKQKEGTETGRQSDRQVAPEVTGESCSLSAGRQSLLLGHCSSSPPLPLPWLRVGGSDDVTAAHTFARTRACKRTHTHTHTRPLSSLSAAPSLSLSLSSMLLFWEVALGITPVCVWVCVCVCMCLLISPWHTHTYTLTTQSDAHIYCLSDCRSGALAAEIRSQRIPSNFTRNFSSPASSLRRFQRSPLDCCGFLTTTPWLFVAERRAKLARNRICCHRAACCHFRTETRSRSADRR